MVLVIPEPMMTLFTDTYMRHNEHALSRLLRSVSPVVVAK